MKLQDLSQITSEWIQSGGNEMLLSYFNRGFFKTEAELGYLHCSYSPYKIPRGLSKLQVRRRINGFLKNKKKMDNSLLNTNRVTLQFNGVTILGASVMSKRPENSRQMNKLLKDILDFSKAPRRPLPKGF